MIAVWLNLGNRQTSWFQTCDLLFHYFFHGFHISGKVKLQDYITIFFCDSVVVYTFLNKQKIPGSTRVPIRVVNIFQSSIIQVW